MFNYEFNTQHYSAKTSYNWLIINSRKSFLLFTPSGRAHLSLHVLYILLGTWLYLSVTLVGFIWLTSNSLFNKVDSKNSLIVKMTRNCQTYGTLNVPRSRAIASLILSSDWRIEKTVSDDNLMDKYSNMFSFYFCWWQFKT